MTSMEKKSKKQWIYVYILIITIFIYVIIYPVYKLIYFAIHLKLTQYCKSVILQ